jgi:hypothetical protein
MNARTKSVVTICLAAAVLVPAAQGGLGASSSTQVSPSRPDDRAESRGPGALTSTQATTGHPDNRAESRGPGSIVAQSGAARPDDRSGVRGPGAVTSVAARPSSSGFESAGALIAVVGGLGAALLLTGCGVLLLVVRSKVRVA